jgi:hypothetical protein
MKIIALDLNVNEILTKELRYKPRSNKGFLFLRGCDERD